MGDADGESRSSTTRPRVRACSGVIEPERAQAAAAARRTRVRKREVHPLAVRDRGPDRERGSSDIAQVAARAHSGWSHDFPKPGHRFPGPDTVVRGRRRRSRLIIDDIAARFRGRVDAVAGIEARGFILGAPVALALGVPFIAIRKARQAARARRWLADLRPGIRHCHHRDRRRRGRCRGWPGAAGGRRTRDRRHGGCCLRAELVERAGACVTWSPYNCCSNWPSWTAARPCASRDVHVLSCPWTAD